MTPRIIILLSCFFYLFSAVTANDTLKIKEQLDIVVSYYTADRIQSVITHHNKLKSEFLRDIEGYNSLPPNEKPKYVYEHIDDIDSFLGHEEAYEFVKDINNLDFNGLDEEAKAYYYLTKVKSITTEYQPNTYYYDGIDYLIKAKNHIEKLEDDCLFSIYHSYASQLYGELDVAISNFHILRARFYDEKSPECVYAHEEYTTTLMHLPYYKQEDFLLIERSNQFIFDHVFKPDAETLVGVPSHLIFAYYLAQDYNLTATEASLHEITLKLAKGINTEGFWEYFYSFLYFHYLDKNDFHNLSKVKDSLYQYSPFNRVSIILDYYLDIEEEIDDIELLKDAAEYEVRNKNFSLAQEIYADISEMYQEIEGSGAVDSVVYFANQVVNLNDSLRILENSTNSYYNNELTDINAPFYRGKKETTIFGKYFWLVASGVLGILFLISIKRSLNNGVRSQSSEIELSDNAQELSRLGAIDGANESSLSELAHETNSLKKPENAEVIQKHLDRLISDSAMLNKDFNFQVFAKQNRLRLQDIRDTVVYHDGMSLSEWLHHQRIAYFEKYLLEEEMAEKYSIEGISALLGYKNYKTFYNAFRKIKGIAPTKYIQQMKNDKKNEL